MDGESTASTGLAGKTSTASTGSAGKTSTASKAGKTSKASKFRAVEQETACEAPPRFEIRSGAGLCLDSSRKRAAFAKCNNTPAQSFAVKDGHIQVNGFHD